MGNRKPKAKETVDSLWAFFVQQTFWKGGENISAYWLNCWKPIKKDK
jgi:hypothetical protein